jgi:hypothetical protein
MISPHPNCVGNKPLGNRSKRNFIRYSYRRNLGTLGYAVTG